MSAQDLMEDLQVAVSEPQGRKLMKGQSIQLSAHQVGGQIPSTIKVDAKKAKKIMRAIQRGRGARMSLSPQEMEMNGAGLWDIIKKGAKWLKDNNLIRPVLKAGARVGLPLIAGIVSGPAGAAATSAAVEKYGDDVISKVGNTVGFGMKGKGMKGGAMMKKRKAPAKAPAAKAPRARPIPQLSNSSFFLTPISAASNPPAASVPDQSMARLFPRGVSKTGTQVVEGAGFRGGSFRQMGSSFKPSGY